MFACCLHILLHYSTSGTTVNYCRCYSNTYPDYYYSHNYPNDYYYYYYDYY